MRPGLTIPRDIIEWKYFYRMKIFHWMETNFIQWNIIPNEYYFYRMKIYFFIKWKYKFYRIKIFLSNANIFFIEWKYLYPMQIYFYRMKIIFIEFCYIFCNHSHYRTHGHHHITLEGIRQPWTAVSAFLDIISMPLPILAEAGFYKPFENKLLFFFFFLRQLADDVLLILCNTMKNDPLASFMSHNRW